MKNMLPFLLISFEIVVFLSMDMYTPALPSLAKEFGLPVDSAQYTVTAWFLGALVLQLTAGPISDRWGRKPVLISGIALFVFSSFLCFFTPNFSLLLFARFLQGSTVAVPLVAGYAAIHETFDDQNSIKTLTFMGSVTVLAPALGPLLGSFVLSYNDWRGIFLCLGLGGCLSLLFSLLGLKETLTQAHPLNIKNTLQSYFQILCNKNFLRFSIPLSLSMASFVMWLIESPFIIISHLGYTTSLFGLIQMLIFSVYILGSKALPQLLNKWNPIYLIRIGLMITLFSGISLFIFGALFPQNLVLATLSMMAYAGGLSLCVGPCNRLAITSIKNIPMGLRTSMFASVMNLFCAGSTLFIVLIKNKTILNLSIVMLVSVFFGFIFSLFTSEVKTSDATYKK